MSSVTLGRSNCYEGAAREQVYAKLTPSTRHPSYVANAMILFLWHCMAGDQEVRQNNHFRLDELAVNQRTTSVSTVMSELKLKGRVTTGTTRPVSYSQQSKQ